MATEVEEDVVSYPPLELVEVAPASPARRAAAEEGGGVPTRPSVRLGRELSIKKKRQVVRKTTAADGEGGEEQTPFQREAARYEQWEELTVNFGNLRQSSRRLEDRIALHHRTVAHRPQYTRRNVWQLFINVHWPKIKSRLRVVFGYELWNGHLKEVEGHFGTAVVSYFIFLRWLFLMNLFIFLLWFGLAVIPQLVWVSGTNAPRTPSQLACVFPLNTSGSPQICSDGGPPGEFLLSGPPAPNDLVRYGGRLLCRGGEADEREGRFDVGQCQFQTGENGTLVADRASPTRSVSDLTTCFNITESGDPLMCPGVDPVVQWYEYIFDFALGRGIFNDTVLFQGRYTNETVEVVGGTRYDLPVAYILLTGSVFLISVVLLVYKMGQAYNESNLQLSRRQTINYCNKLFSSWEFSVTDHSTAKLRRAQIKRQIEEDIADLEKRSQKRDNREIALVILIRTLTNLSVLLILIGAGVAIFMAAQLGLDSQLSGESLQLGGFCSANCLHGFQHLPPHPLLLPGQV
ncbi:Transmembrane channel-like protein 7 [Geodia barretti]|uniref:Transmembrane channel-like protein 7 n=1 Tax=Geodia barretti TaxID=519541 RepID=A0AA35TR55_GEOBA|nr:Transmembrane channel-like protein 7 [Geodia barretti]